MQIPTCMTGSCCGPVASAWVADMMHADSNPTVGSLFLPWFYSVTRFKPCNNAVFFRYFFRELIFYPVETQTYHHTPHTTPHHTAPDAPSPPSFALATFSCPK